MEASVATAAGQGAPTPAAQPAAAGQGQGAGSPTAGSNGDGQFNWGMFPDVPEDQRAALEPHLRNVQGYVTRQEQQYAPYKPLTDVLAGDQVENMVGFLNAYNSDPVATVLGMVRQAMEEGSLTTEQLQELAGGQQGAAPGQQEQPGQQQSEEMPAWAREIQGRFAQFDQAMEAQQAQEAEAEQAQILERAKTGIRGQLTQGGISEELIPDEMVVASIIAHNGDEQAAAQSLLQLRQNFLGDFTKNTPASGKQPTQQGKLPQAPKKGGRRDPDGFGDAKLGAEQFLRQQVAGASG